MAESLATLQHRWADHMRDPSRPAPQDIEPRRLRAYRRLCIDSLDSLLSSSLPRLQQQLGSVQWRATVEYYYANHACQTPLFPQIAGEFAHWLAVQQPLPLPSWAAELAHYESTQLAVQIEPRDAGLPLQHAPAADDVLAVSAHARVLGYQWPVHADDVLHQHTDATPTLLLMRRLPDFSLQVAALAPLAYALLSAFGSDGTRVDLAQQALAAAHGIAPAELQALCAPLLAELCAAGVLVALTAA
ncbi:MAG: putative DNA-binding domain-containing protein [Stenotrophomonas sp.]